MFFYLMLVVILLILELFYTYNPNKRSKKMIFYLGILILTIISACRKISVGADLENYISVVRTMGKTRFKEIVRLFQASGVFVRIDIKSTGIAMEGGFLLLSKLIGGIESAPQFFIIVTSIIIIIGISAFIMRYSQNPCSSLVLLVLFGFYGQTMNVIRNYLAIIILLFGITFLEEKKYLKFLVVGVIAFLLHRSAIIFLLMPVCMFFAENSNRVKIYRGTVAFFMIFLALFAEGIVKKAIEIYYGYNVYLDTSWQINKMLCVFLCLYIFIMIFSNKDFLNEKMNVFFINAFCIAILVQVLAPYFETLGRVRTYFEIFLIVLIPNIIESQKNYHQKIFLRSLIYCVLFVFYLLLLRKDGAQIIPYTPYWEN